MKRLSWFPDSDPAQVVRFRRFLIAAATSLMLLALLAFYHFEGLLDLEPLLVTALGTLIAIAIFYALFRSGWNKRARDPSLTIPMMMAAASMVSYALYHLGAMRSGLLLLYPVIMFFGVFRLDTRSLLLLGGYILAGYALAVGLLWGGPRRVDHPNVDVVQFVVLASVIVWFSIMGGYVHDLRRRARLGEYDWLTRSYNRRRILELLEREKVRCDRSAAALCVCMVDLDRFKSINDSFGHHAGDAVLQTFVRVALDELRAGDSIGRYGGEEFLLVLADTPMSGAQECAERVRRQLEAADFRGVDPRCRATVSIGVAQYRPGEDIAETLKRADQALYRAKAAGRNRVVCE